MYVIEDSHGAPQCGVEVLVFEEFYELEEYLDEHQDVYDRLTDGYAIIREVN